MVWREVFKMVIWIGSYWQRNCFLYFRGSTDGSKFVGWLGTAGENDSSKVLNDILTMKLDDNSFSASFLVNGSNGWISAETDFKTPVHPFGRCKAVKPPAGVLYHDVESLSIKLKNKTQKNKTIKVILRDPNSVWLYPTAFQTRGDHMEMSFGGEGTNTTSMYKQFKARMSWTYHVEGDPLLQCRDYNSNFTLNDCVKEELHNLFMKELGCIPPLFTENGMNICQKPFNLSQFEEVKTKRMFWKIYEKYRPLDCQAACSKVVVETQLMYEDSFPNPTLDLIFHPEVEVTRSTFSLTFERLLADLGGSVSGG